MILALFIVILAAGLILAALGYYTEEGSYSLIGFLIIFLLGLWILIPGDLQIKTGSNTTTTYTYVCGCCENNTFITETTGRLVYDCYGEPYFCDYYDGDLTNCLLAGCSYNETTMLCGGTPTPCDELAYQDCEYYGCELDEEIITSGGCTNGSEEVINQTIIKQNDTYENFSDTFSHILGFWLTIMGLVGFIIKITEIRRGIPK